jgi:hypothetical protein
MSSHSEKTVEKNKISALGASTISGGDVYGKVIYDSFH